MKFLIVDGYPEAARQELQSNGASTGWQLFQRMLLRRDPAAEVETIFPSDQEEIPSPQELAGYDGLLWTGCSLCCHASDDPRVDRQIELARRAFAMGVPQFGSCWAIQIAAVAAGGTVAANPRGREMGLARKIGLTPEGQRHPMYAGKPPVFDAFICHLDEVTSWPESATLLATNSFTQVQALEVRHLDGVFWGVQYHPEYTLEDMAALTWARRAPLVKEGFFADEAAVGEHVSRLRTLQADPTRKDLSWSLAIDQDVLDDDVRQCELINWLAFVGQRQKVAS
jgi:GMP synthase (glutamine-hydrolysing)